MYIHPLFQKLLEAHEEQNSEAFTEAVSDKPLLIKLYFYLNTCK